MAVPDTNTFSLQDVCDELNNNGESGIDDLTACFANANAAGFDATYEGSKDRLSNFRNYEHITVPLDTNTEITTISDSSTWKADNVNWTGDIPDWEWSGAVVGSVNNSATPTIDFSSNTSNDPIYIILQGNLTTLRLPSLSLTDIDVSGKLNLTYLDLSGNNLLAPSVRDSVYIDLDAAGPSNGTLLMPTTPPYRTSASDAARSNLISKGWSITD